MDGRTEREGPASIHLWPILCARCGKLHTFFFHVPDEDWRNTLTRARGGRLYVGLLPRHKKLIDVAGAIVKRDDFQTVLIFFVGSVSGRRAYGQDTGESRAELIGCLTQGQERVIKELLRAYGKEPNACSLSPFRASRP